MEFSFPSQPLLGIFLSTANKGTVIPTSRRSTCPLTTGLLPLPGCICATPGHETALAAHCHNPEPGRSHGCLLPSRAGRESTAFVQCLLLPLISLGNNQQVNNTQHLFINKENPHLSAFLYFFFVAVVVLIPVSNKALTQLNKALQSLAQITLATGRSIAFLYLSALLGREKGPLLSQPRHLQKASMCCEPGPLTGRAEKR